MPVNYEILVSNLMRTLPFVNALTIIEGRAEIVYSTNNWDIKADVDEIISGWSSLKSQPINVSGIEYLMRLFTSDRLVATSVKGKGHIVGVKDDKRTIIALIEPDGIIPFAFIEMARELAALRIKREVNRINERTVKNSENLKKKEAKRGKKKHPQKQNEQKQDNIDTGLPFTARLMAYYRALEYKKEEPLIMDPFAEYLAGDMTTYLNEHIRFSEMDYPIVRSYYIENNLLTPWCKTGEVSQILFLGAGLDTRAYRFKHFKTNLHTIFEIDFPIVNHYKEKVLRGMKPLCKLVRLYTDFTSPTWTTDLIESGFSVDIPTFWVLEGVAYYMEQKVISSLLIKAAEISVEKSQIFVDIMHASRWFPFPYTSPNDLRDPFTRHVKWDLNIKSVPSFFEPTGWDVTCSFADKHDQGRNVGQKGMIFIHGIRKR